ncbi:MAG: ribulose-phosphate 3-epimerase [Paludibacter sp. 47-17]|nr:MAG: ribulose-phosphate 3-epimerase [Paludibacter sp. SCN 50-10]OJX83386.1 MAG: ribulose-phosphate 3-epimerase [Paludibacter sp. 47-17]
MERIISPSILAADFGDLKSECEMINRSDARWVHIDVMDGVFVPNISFGFPVIEAVRRHCTKLMDVHIMIVNPEKYVRRFAEAGARMLTFHYEATADPAVVIRLIRAEGIKVGITINPDVPVDKLRPFIADVDMVLLMTVFAGYGGQKFIPESFERLRALAGMRDELNPSCMIQVDGGVGASNASQLYECGANVLVAGSSVFNAADPPAMIRQLLDA